MTDVDSKSLSELLCFVHLEKAAGMTFMGILSANYPSYLALSPFILPAEKNESLTQTEMRWLLRLFPFTKAFGGHSVRSYENYSEAAGKSVRYLTFLREPTSRYISHYNHQRGKGGFSDIHSFLADPNYDNMMVRKLAGEPDLERAIEAVESEFSMVALVEHFDESLVLLKSRLGRPEFDIRYEQTNKSWDPGYKKRDELSDPAVVEAIRQKNDLDLKLYAHVKDVLWPRYRGDYGPALKQDIAAFQESNQGFESSKSRAFFVRGYRWLAYRNVELALRRLVHGKTDTDMEAKLAVLKYKFRRARARLRP